MAQRMIEMRFIAYWQEYRPGQVVTVTLGQAAIWEAKRVAVRVRSPHNTKPIDNRHSVTKGE